LLNVGKCWGITLTETDPVSETVCSLVFRIPNDGESPKSQ
jgi:hypothetical protein